MKITEEMMNVFMAAVQVADWNWIQFDKPGLERNFDLDESDEYVVEHHPVLKENGVENAVWNYESPSKLNIHFNTMSKMAITILQADMDGGINGVYKTTRDKRGEFIPCDVCVGQLDGFDIYVCPYTVSYEDGWLTLTCKVTRE